MTTNLNPKIVEIAGSAAAYSGHLWAYTEADVVQIVQPNCSPVRLS